MLLAQAMTRRVIEVHRNTGCGLLWSVYDRCLCRELHRSGMSFERQVSIPVIQKGDVLDDGFRTNIVVNCQVILEVKSMATTLPANKAHLLTHLRMSRSRVGVMFNFARVALVVDTPDQTPLARGCGIVRKDSNTESRGGPPRATERFRVINRMVMNSRIETPRRRKFASRRTVTVR